MIFGLAQAWAPTASAVTILNCTSDATCAASTTIFQDTFESGTTPPTPQTGIWTIFASGSSVTNAAVPGAAEGTFYAQLTRTPAAFPTMIGSVSVDPNLNDIVRLKMMVYIPAASDIANRVDFALIGDNGLIWVDVGTDGAGHVNNIDSTFTRHATTLTYTAAAWQEWDLQYMVGASTFSATVNGVTLGGLPVFQAAPNGGLFGLEFQNLPQDGLPFFVDAVPTQVTGGAPEPGSLWLLGAGVVALGVGRRLKS